MSWYTVGEILVWLLIAAILGFILGLLIGMLFSGKSKLKRRIAELEEDLENCRASKPSTAELRAVKKSSSEAESASSSTKKSESEAAESDQSQSKTETVTATTDKSKLEQAEQPEKPEKEVKEATLKARAEVGEIAKRTSGGKTGVKDDLQLVHGIGPKISELLYSMEITSFAQIARFNKKDIAIVSDALEVFPDRIERDDWMSSAKALHKEKYGEEL